MNIVKKANENIDWSIVVSAVVASAVVGGTVYGLRQAGFGGAAKIVKGG